MAASVLPAIRAEATASVASSFDHLHPRAKEKQTIKVKENDPLKVLDPARKKLTSVEAQRVLAVLDETIRRVEVVSLLPHITENIERFSVILGTDLVQAMVEHGQLQSLYQKAAAKLGLEQCRARSASPAGSTEYSSRPSSRSSAAPAADEDDFNSHKLENQQESRTSSVASSAAKSMKSRGTPASFGTRSPPPSAESFQALEFQLRDSLRNVLRLFSSNPAARSALQSEGYQRSYETRKMIGELMTLRAILFERLLTTPSEEKERRQYLKEVVNRERKSSALAGKLQEELKKAVDDKDTEVSKRNDIIRRLKNDIYTVEKNAEEQNRRVITEAAKQDAAEMKNSDSKKSKLHQEIIELKKKLEADTTGHRESELALRKRKYKIETEVENWIQKFDSDMGERQDEFDALDAVYTEEKKQLNELEERFKTLEKEYLTIVEERRIAKEKAEAAERELNLKIRAARLIQSLWRAHRARKQLNKKKKGKKGKKGKKSGKGKKKR